MCLLQALADGRPHPATALPGAWLASRRKDALERLDRWGLGVVRDQAGMLRLQRPVELLAEERIYQALSEDLRARLRLHVFPELDSTSVWLGRLDADSGDVACFAEHQSAGRGRRGRGWQMPFGGGLAMSLRRDVSHWPGVPPRLTLALGVALAEALGHDEIGLKWPNDLVARGRKLGGILVELRRREQRSVLVVGLGLNLALPADAAIDQPWIDLAGLMGTGLPPRNALAGHLLEALSRALDDFYAQPAETLLARWSRYDVLSGVPVRVTSAMDEVLEGEARGVDSEGRLRVVGQDREWLLDAGEVSVRRALP